MIIRQARSADYDCIYELVKTAFQTAKVADGTEQDFVLELRKGKYIPGLELVAEEDGALSGHVMLTGTAIRGDGKVAETLLLAPLCVALERRDKGIGTALMLEALGKAKTLGHASVVLIDHPASYGRFGFRAVPGITHPGVPAQYTLIRELVPGALSGVAGTID